MYDVPVSFLRFFFCNEFSGQRSIAIKNIACVSIYCVLHSLRTSFALCIFHANFISWYKTIQISPKWKFPKNLNTTNDNNEKNCRNVKNVHFKCVFAKEKKTMKRWTHYQSNKITWMPDQFQLTSTSYGIVIIEDILVLLEVIRFQRLNICRCHLTKYADTNIIKAFTLFPKNHNNHCKVYHATDKSSDNL